jgi:hypothetical protein
MYPVLILCWQITIQCVPKVKLGCQMNGLLEWNTTDKWHAHETGGTVDNRGLGGREDKQLRAQRIQGDAHSQSDLHKMATVQWRVQCVMWPAKFESVTQVWRQSSHINRIRRWDRQLRKTGSLLHKQHSASPSGNFVDRNFTHSFNAQQIASTTLSIQHSE